MILPRLKIHFSRILTILNNIFLDKIADFLLKNIYRHIILVNLLFYLCMSYFLTCVTLNSGTGGKEEPNLPNCTTEQMMR
jgi:hypothetical protein